MLSNAQLRFATDLVNDDRTVVGVYADGKTPNVVYINRKGMAAVLKGREMIAMVVAGKAAVNAGKAAAKAAVIPASKLVTVSSKVSTEHKVLSVTVNTGKGMVSQALKAEARSIAAASIKSYPGWRCIVRNQTGRQVLASVAAS